MASEPVTSFLWDGRRLRPWPILLLGLGITGLGLLLLLFGDALAPARFLTFLAGLVTAGVGVRLRFKTAGQAFEERMETAGALAVAAFAALLAFLGSEAWDSMQYVLLALIAAALVGVVLVLLPTPARMLAVGVLVLVHFGGMITAATTIEPPGASAPWLSVEAWVHFYRPYLQFMYLNNAYHFYSPEPGPPSLLWFHIKYRDGQVKWVKIPNRDADPVPIHHTRLLSITESTALFAPPVQDPNRWAALLQDRDDQLGPNETEHKRFPQNLIPMAPYYIMQPGQQYQEAAPYAQKMIESYVRHIAQTNPFPGDPGNTIKGIKVYRFRQTIIGPKQMADGRNPLDPSHFVGYFEGEYNEKGEALHTQDVYDQNHKQVDWRDPFRFWYVPIYYQTRHGEPMLPGTKPEDMDLVDCLTRHARLDFSQTPPVESDDPNDSPWDDGAEGHSP